MGIAEWPSQLDMSSWGCGEAVLINAATPAHRRVAVLYSMLAASFVNIVSVCNTRAASGLRSDDEALRRSGGGAGEFLRRFPASSSFITFDMPTTLILHHEQLPPMQQHASVDRILAGTRLMEENRVRHGRHAPPAVFARPSSTIAVQPISDGTLHSDHLLGLPPSQAGKRGTRG